MKRPPAWFFAALLTIPAGVILLARSTALTFPYPWNDEARFFLPSLEFARTGSLRPAMLHAPEGIFWTPHGFYVVLGLVLRVFGGTMGVARTANQVLMAAAAAGVVLANARLARSYGVAALAGLVLLSPPVILAANEVRMEALVSLLYAVALLLVSRHRVVGALAVLLLSVLVHPALVFALAGLGAVLATGRLRRSWASRSVPSGVRSRAAAPPEESEVAGGVRWAGWEWALLAVAVVAVLLEARFVLGHWALFRAHMSYQSGRKLHRGVLAALAKPQGGLLVVEAGVTGMLVARRLRAARAEGARLGELLLPAAMALGLQLYAVLGAEFQYDVYSLAVTPATFFAIAYRLAADRSGQRAGMLPDESASEAPITHGVAPELSAAAGAGAALARGGGMGHRAGGLGVAEGDRQ